MPWSTVRQKNCYKNIIWYVYTCNYVEWCVYSIPCLMSLWDDSLHLKSSVVNVNNHNENKATRSPEISRQQVEKLTPQFLFYIYWNREFPLSLSTIWGNDLPVNFMFKFPTCISTIWRNHLPHLTSSCKWRGTFQYFQHTKKTRRKH